MQLQPVVEVDSEEVSGAEAAGVAEEVEVAVVADAAVAGRTLTRSGCL